MQTAILVRLRVKLYLCGQKRKKDEERFNAIDTLPSHIGLWKHKGRQADIYPPMSLDATSCKISHG